MGRHSGEVRRLPFLKSLSVKLGPLLALYGGWGIFLMSFLDASFVPFPVLNDLALILLAAKHPGRAPIYALQSTVGSLLGCYLLYGIARGGGKFLHRKSTSAAITRAERWLARNDFVALLVACLLPPPAPLKLFVITAGVLRVDAVHFGAALLVGRSLRFAADAWLGARYGAHAEAYLRQNFVWASLAAVVLVICLTLIYRLVKRRSAGEPGNSSEPPCGIA